MALSKPSPYKITSYLRYQYLAQHLVGVANVAFYYSFITNTPLNKETTGNKSPFPHLLSQFYRGRQPSPPRAGDSSSLLIYIGWEKMAWRAPLSKNIKELRFLMCQTSPSSSGIRAFVEKNYKELKTLNPKLPILIREARGIEPQIWARYDMGVEKGVRLEGLGESSIAKALEDLVKAAGKA